MLFPMPDRTSWNSSEGRRSSSQNVLPPVAAVQTDGFQGFPGCMLRRPDGVRAVVQLERVCVRLARDGRGRLNNSCVIFFVLKSRSSFVHYFERYEDGGLVKHSIEHLNSCL